MTWFLSDGATVELVVLRYNTTRREELRVRHVVSRLPTKLDISVNDPQFLWFAIPWLVPLIVTALTTTVVVAVVKNETRVSRNVQMIDKGEYRKLTAAEKVGQNPDFLHLITKTVKMSFTLDGKTEFVTIPANNAFDGDSIKKRVGLENSGPAWVVHDWLYNTKRTQS